MAEYQISARLTLKDMMTAQLRTAANAAQKLTRGVGSAAKGIGDIKLNVQGLEKLQRYRDLLRQAGMTQPKPINLRVNDNGATSKISKIRSDITSLAGRTWNVAVNIKTNGMAALNRAKSTVSEMATGAAMATGAGVLGTAGVGFGAVNMIETYKDFEYQMKRNKALFTTGMDATEANAIYQKLEESALHYGSIMKFTASEVGKAQEYMALAGWDADKAMAALPSVLNAAVASGEDLSLVSDIITDDMTAMGYKAGDIIKNAMGENVEAAQHFTDVMLRTTLRSNTNFQQLGLAMKYAAPLAHTLGFKIEEVAVALGLMANNGIKADQAGTGLRGILNRLINEPKKAAQSLERLGVSLFDTQGNAKGLMTTLMDIRAAMNGRDADAMVNFVEEMSGEQIENKREVTDFLKEAMERGGGKISAQDQAKLGSMLSGTYALSAFMALMNSTDEDIQKMMTEIYQKSDGTGAEIAKEMSNTLEGDLKTLQSAWEAFNIEIMRGDAASGLRGFIQTLTQDITQFKNAIKDGLDFKDIGQLGLTVLDQLKDKFLQLDGVGSLLAGGALFMGLKKIFSMGLKLKDTLTTLAKVKTASDVGTLLRGGQGAIGASSVGTMHVSAGVVNLTGAVRGGTPPAGGQRGGVVTTGGTTGRPTGGVITTTGRPPTTGGITSGVATAGAATAGSILVSSRGGRNVSTYTPPSQPNIAARNSAYVNDYYARRASFVPPVTSTVPPSTVPPTPTGAMGNIRANVGGIAGAGLLALLFGAADIYSAKSHSEQTSREAAETVAYHKNVLAELQSQGASSDKIAAQIQNVQEAEAFADRTRIMNADIERQAQFSAAGMVTGSALGAALGSVFPIVGTMLGGMLGGFVGQFAGTKLAEHEAERQAQMRSGGVDGGDTSNQAEPHNRTAPTNTAGMGVGVGAGDNREVQKAWEKHEKQQNEQRGGQGGTWGSPEKSATVTGSSTSSVEHPEGMDALTWAQVKRRQADIDERNPYQQMQDRARMAELAHQRDLYNKRWQEQFGGTSLGGQANFVPDNERDRKLLAEYDRQKAYEQLGDRPTPDKVAQEKRLADLTSHGGAGGDIPKPSVNPLDKTLGDNKTLAEKSIADQKTALDKLAEVTNQWNQQQQASLGEIANQKKLAENAKNAATENKGLLGMLDDLLFSKAAANPITSDTNTTPSTVPPQELPTAAIKHEAIEPPKPEGGFFDFSNFKLPNFSEMFSNIELPDLSSFLDKVLNIKNLFGGVELPNFKDLFSGIELPDLSGFLDKLPNLTELFGGVELPNFGELFNFDFEIPDLGTKISEMFSNVEVPDLGTRFSEIFSGVEIPELGINEKLTAEFEGSTAIFEGFGATVTATFSGLAGSISGALSGVGSAITSVFDGAASQVQATWGSMPGFFSGVFGGLGGAAAAAGSAIYSGLTSVIGAVIGAWQSAASTISGIISSISAMASSAASLIPSFGGIGGHAKGTSYFEGGWTEINEHGGEIINLPKGTQIIPHATTVKLLRNEIRQKIDNGETDFHGLPFSKFGMESEGDNFSTSNFAKSNSATFTNNILGGDIIKPDIGDLQRQGRVRQGQRWNMKPTGGLFGGILSEKLGGLGGMLGGLFGQILLDKTGGRKPTSALEGDIIKPDIGDLQRQGRVRQGQRWNMKPAGGLFGGIMGGGFTGGEVLSNPPIMNFGGDNSDFPITPFQNNALADKNLDFTSRFDDKLDFEVPKYEVPKVAESSSNTTSNSNTINFGDVNINNGADFDEFMFRMQQLLGHASANSEWA